MMAEPKQLILQNPFHPLDLSPHDLLSVYKRFEQSRQINRNSKHQLPIEIIAQLISSLKGCPPSYVQKCMSQALIKDTLSWNDFLTFLDQESQVREKILGWLMYEKSIIKYKLDKMLAIRSKIQQNYQFVTFLKFMQLSNEQKFIICSIDQSQIILIAITQQGYKVVDRYYNKNDKPDSLQPHHQPQIRNRSFVKGRLLQNKSNIRMTNHKTQRIRQQKEKLHSFSSSQKMNDIAPCMTMEEEDNYFKKERKTINSLFNVFKELPMEHSVKFAKLASQKISERNMNPAHITALKDNYSTFIELKSQQSKKINLQHQKAIDKVKSKLKFLYQQKKTLSYNPYNPPKYTETELQSLDCSKLKKTLIFKEKKDKEYNLQSIHQVLNYKLRCMCVVYYNLELVLIKVVREYNKIGLEAQDSIRLLSARDHKKNQIIEGIDFYFHSILNTWFILILVRVEFKNEYRNDSLSYLVGYQVELIQNKRRSDFDIKFKSPKESFTMTIGNYEVIAMDVQPQSGIHLITCNGRYLSFKEDYIEGNLPEEHIYFTLHHEEKFRNNTLSLCCLAVSSELNKALFGTVKGVIVIYDLFSHLSKVKKVANSQIAEVKIDGTFGFILTIDQKVLIYDLIRCEEVQSLNIKNEDKLHQKIKRIQIHQKELICFGSEVKSYKQFTDEELLHQKRKMQNMYTWRINKLFTTEQQKSTKAIKPDAIQVDKRKSAATYGIQMVIASENYFIILTQILQIMVINKHTLKLKFSMILDVPHDSKVMRMCLSPSQKLLSLLLFTQSIHVINIHTQDEYKQVQSSPFLKFTSIAFLDEKNEYLLAAGTQSGKIALIPFVGRVQKNQKILAGHTKSVGYMARAGSDFLISCGEDMIVNVWMLPFNVLRHQILIPSLITDIIGIAKENVFLRAINGYILHINIVDGRIISKFYIDWSIGSLDGCLLSLVGINKKGEYQILKKEKESKDWKTSVIAKGQGKGEAKFIGVIQSQKMLVFYENGTVISWNYQASKPSKPLPLISFFS